MRIQVGIGVTEWVIGPAGAKIQHQQCSRAQVLSMICADETSLAPTVIYKGEAFQTKWPQNNLLDARYDSRGERFLKVPKLIFLAGWDTRRRATHQGKLVLPGLKTEINRPRQRQMDEHDCFLLMVTAHITCLGF